MRSRREGAGPANRAAYCRRILRPLDFLRVWRFFSSCFLFFLNSALAIVVERLLCRYALVPRCLVRGRLKPAELVGLALGFVPALLVRLRRGGLLSGLFMYVAGVAAVFAWRGEVFGLARYIFVERLPCCFARVPRCMVGGRLEPAELVDLALGVDRRGILTPLVG